MLFSETSNLMEQEKIYQKKACEVIDNIKKEKRSFVKYRDGLPITDIRHMLKQTCEIFGEKTAFYQKFNKGEAYSSISYNTLMEDVNALGTALCSMGLKGKRIALIGENSYMWCVSYLSVVCGTGVIVPIDKELSKAEIKNLIARADVSCVMTTQKHLNDALEIKEESTGSLETVISIGKEHKDAILWQELIKTGKEMVRAGNKEFIEAEINREDVMVILFTSGTTGKPKGVMHSHWTLAYDIMVAPTLLKVSPEDIFFSVLPLHHTYESTCGFLLSIYRGSAVAFCQGLKYITKNLEEIKPTMFLGVPAIFENVHKKIWQNIRAQGKEKTVRRMMNLTNAGNKLGINLAKPIFKKVRAVFGGNLRILICGGAAIDPQVLEDFKVFGINAVQGYGVTESAPLAALNPDTCPVNSAIGVEFPGIKLDIYEADANGIGEIIVKGENVMLGYYDMPEETAEAIVDGWYHTGDFGYRDEKGYYYITGRKKNIIIAKNGKNIYPEEIEYDLNLNPEIAESMVFEDERQGKEDILIAASIVVDEELVEEFHGKDLDEAEIEKIIWSCVDKVNKSSPFYRKIKKIYIRRTPLEKNTSNKILRFEEGNKGGI